MFKIFNFASILLTALLLSGCWGFNVPRWDTPEEFTEGKKTVRSSLGATKQEVIDKVGQPRWIALKDSKTYYIYQWYSGEAVIVMIGYIHIPWVFTGEQASGKEAVQAHCILLEFVNDRRLKSYKVDTESTYNIHMMGQMGDPVNCLEVFEMSEYVLKQHKLEEIQKQEERVENETPEKKLLP